MAFFSTPWKKRFFTLFGEKTHLDAIEHKMIRKWFNEPRIHFAVNCASIGCPALLNEAYQGAKLEKQLQESSRRFLSDQSRNRLDRKKRTLYISKIFKWYGDDFKKTYGNYLSFIGDHMKLSPLSHQLIKGGKFKVEFLSYDWNLNIAD